jgi:hypothetical protein
MKAEGQAQKERPGGTKASRKQNKCGNQSTAPAPEANSPIERIRHRVDPSEPSALEAKQRPRAKNGHVKVGGRGMNVQMEFAFVRHAVCRVVKRRSSQLFDHPRQDAATGESGHEPPLYIEGPPSIDDQRVRALIDLMEEGNAEAPGDLLRECPKLFSSNGTFVEHESCSQSDEDLGGDQDF